MALPPRFAHLVGSKWTSTAPVLGWRHFHVGTLQRSGGGWQVEVIASVDPTARTVVDARELFDKAKWTAGWVTLEALRRP